LEPNRVCKKCGQAFVFDAVHYAKTRQPAPQTCPACRRLR
jgi:rubrerythrin